ncbi:MAG: hypothetical protein JO118_09505, partial [Acetobacteraceae bacterium]|nr:hypothetical protein [Acetobacteraceae bacterium]
MRKLLLASVAVLGGLASGQAIAQTSGLRVGSEIPAPTPGPLPPTWIEGPQPTAPSGIAGANSNLSAQGFYTSGPLPAPTPGSIVVRFNGRVVFYGYVDSATSNTGGGRKTQPYGTLGYLRLYPGVDGMTSGGLRYGAAAEIRIGQSYSNASTTSGGASGATYGSPTTTIVTGSGAASSFTYVPGTQLIMRRAFLYLGGNWGAMHFGQDDGAISLLDAGV